MQDCVCHARDGDRGRKYYNFFIFHISMFVSTSIRPRTGTIMFVNPISVSLEWLIQVFSPLFEKQNISP